MARARLRDRHQESLRRKLELLKAEQAVNISAPQENQPHLGESSSHDNAEPKPTTSADDEHLSENEGYVLKFCSNHFENFMLKYNRF